MASVSKTRNGYWRVLWRDDQKVKRQKNFRTAAEARKFAAALELSPERRSSTITVSDWLVSYRDNESQKKRGAKQEVLRINRFLQRPFASMKLWDEGTKNGPDRSALLGHNFVYQETKSHGFYSSYFHQRISS